MTLQKIRISSLVIALGLVAFSAVPAKAIFGFGIHGGYDFVSFDEKSFSTTQFVDAAEAAGIENFDRSTWTTAWTGVNMTREAIGNPYLIGAHFYIDVIPVIDIEASLDVSIQKYEVRYTTPVATSNEVADAYFGRIGAYATARRDLIKLPMFAFYLGGGLGMHFVAPVAGADLLVDIYQGDDPTASSPSIEDAIKNETTIGFHAVTGIRFKPPIIPIALRIEGKYTATGASGMERPDSIMSLYIGTSIDI